MLVQLDHFPRFRGENKKYDWNHHLDKHFNLQKIPWNPQIGFLFPHWFDGCDPQDSDGGEFRMKLQFLQMSFGCCCWKLCLISRHQIAQPFTFKANTSGEGEGEEGKFESNWEDLVKTTQKMGYQWDFELEMFLMIDCFFLWLVSGVVLFSEASILDNEVVDCQMVPRFIPKNDMVETKTSTNKIHISAQKKAATSHEASSSSNPM